MRRKLAASIFLIGFPLWGCGSGGGTSPSLQLSSPTSGTVVVRFDSSLATLAGITSVEVDLFGADGSSLGSQTLPLTGRPQELVLTGLPAGPVRVLVIGQSSDGQTVGSREFSLNLQGPLPAQVQVDSLLAAASTREIGLVSVGSNAAQASGPSIDPTLSADGRMVAFSSTANLDNRPPDGNSQIFLRDRLKGTLFRISSPVGSSDPIPGDAIEPDTSGDGQRTVYRLQSRFIDQGPIYVFDASIATNPPPGSLAANLGLNRNTVYGSGRHPRFAASGSSFTYESLINNVSQVFFQSTNPNFPAVALSNAANGTPANGDCTSPAITNGGEVVFHSLATNLIPSGTPGVYVRNIASLSITRLNIAANLRDVDITPDGRFVLASAPGLTPFLLDRQGTGQALPAITGLVGRPSMSDDARYISFFSSSANLVDGDVNNAVDSFVLDRQTGLISRVNVSNDGTAVKGGVDQTSARSGPAISGQGNRVAFSSNDFQLVPNNANRQLDVYSASVPTPGKVYFLNGNAIERDGNIANATSFQNVNTGLVFETLIGGDLTRLIRPSAMFLDVTNDRLYVATRGPATTVGAGEILVFNQASTITGNVAPNRVISGSSVSGARDLLVDPQRNILYLQVGGDVVALNNASTLNGPISPSSARIFRPDGDPVQLGLLLDSRLDRLLLTANESPGTGPNVSVVRASTASGNAPLLARLFGPTVTTFPPTLLAFDPSPTSFQSNSNEANLVVVDPLGRISTFRGNGSGVVTLAPPPLAEVPSTSVSIGAGPGRVDPAAKLVIDPTTNQRYFADQVAHKLLVYRPGVVAPVRTLDVPARALGLTAFPSSVAIDRTR